MTHPVPLALSGAVLCAFLTAAPAWAQGSYPAPDSGRVDANGMPTTQSTPDERAQTRDLNNQIQNRNDAADAQAASANAQYQNQLDATKAQAASSNAQYQQQQQRYQNQLHQNQQAQRDYQDRTAAYESLRAHYAAQRHAYHRAVWPARYRDWQLQGDARLVGSRVEIVNGDRVGTVESVAHAGGGRVEALMVSLDGGKQVWIDEADTRFDRAGGVVMTDLDRADLSAMADERL